MNLADLRARQRRLDQLARGLAKDVLFWQEGADPLLYQERQAYVRAIRAAISGVEAARRPGPRSATTGLKRAENADVERDGGSDDGRQPTRSMRMASAWT